MGEKTNLNYLLGMSILWVVLLSSPGVGKTIYVDDDANGLNDGSSWQNAYKYLQNALADANSSLKPIEIRVAQGIYQPDRDILHPNGTWDRQATFQLINDVTLKGGYAGFFEPDSNARDTTLYQTVLSGDIGKPSDKSDNSYHIFYHPEGLNLNNTAILDGFIITGGYAYGSTWPFHRCGGGMYNYKSSPTITNCTFSGNSADYGGGGIFNDHSSPNVFNCTFSENSADGAGGGMYNYDYSSPTLKDCTFSGNLANRYGGGMYLYRSKPTLINCIFTHNQAPNSSGGGICLWASDPTIIKCTFSMNMAYSEGGAITCWSSNPKIVYSAVIGNRAYGNPGDGGGVRCWGSNASIINCTIADNWANGIGGGINSGFKSMPIIRHCTIVNNTAEEYGGGVGCEGSFAFIKGSILYGNMAGKGNQLAAIDSGPSIIAISYSDVQSGQAAAFVSSISEIRWGTGNIDADPRFVNPQNGDYRLLNSSPCIDTGGPYYYLYGQYFADIKGDCRLAGRSVDMGSNEFDSSSDSDSDLLSDVDEAAYGSNPSNPDSDGDGLFDGVETLRGTDPILSDSPSGISVPAQYLAIQQAIFLAFPLEAITISPGIYYENLYFQGKNLVLRSVEPLDDRIVETTIIDGNEFGTVVTFAGSESSSCILRGFTITNGSFSGVNGNECKATIENNIIVGNYIPELTGSYGGGGIFNCNGLIQSNIISDNSTDGAGGGISRCDGTIRDNIIAGNFAWYRGGGISHCNGLIVNNILKGNLANLAGGGIACYDGNGPTIANCIVSGNVARGHGYAYGDGGGIFCGDSSTRIVNCTIMGNKAYGVNVGGGGVCCNYGIATLENSIVWSNIGIGEIAIFDRRASIAISYCDVQGGLGAVNIYKGEGTLNWGIGNIYIDPCFARPGCWDPNGTPEDANDDIWINGDYHLKSQAGRWDANEGRWTKDDATSLCIDAGDPNSPIGFEPFPNGGIINMGAYGGTREASKSYFGKPPCETIMAGDINGDCIVNLIDFAFMAFHWLEEY